MRSESTLSFTERHRRAQILDAATELLSEGGLAAASLSAIAARIGSSKGVVSYHFDGKDDLLRSVVTSVLTDATEYMTPRITAAPDPRERLRAYVRSNLDYLAANRSRMRALHAVLTGPADSGGGSLYAEPGRDAVRALADLVAAGQRAGQFRGVDAMLVARTVRAAIDAVGDLLHAQPDLDITAYADGLLALVENGIAS